MRNVQLDIVKRSISIILGNAYRKMQLFLIFVLMLPALAACAPDTNLLGSGSWQASTLTQQHIHALAVQPNTPQVLYAGNQDGTIFRSSDGGQHWTKRGPISSTSLVLSRLTVTPSGKTLYALTDSGLFASTDAAQTWQLVNTSNSGLPADDYTTMTFNAPKSIYIGTLHHGIFISNGNHHSHWQAINGTLPLDSAINELAFDSTQHRLWAATALGVYRSDNEGTTWDALNNGLPGTDGVISLQPAASVGGATGLIYVGTKHGIFRSMDAGVHWAESGQVLRGVPIQHILIDYRSTNASTLYVGTRFGVFRSDDNGQNWRGVAAGFPRNTSVYALVIGANKASQLYAAADNVYLFPGNGNGITPTRIITLLLILMLFMSLGLIAQRSVKRRKAFLRPSYSIEPSSPIKKG
ncbi:MAG: hypothetical protein NVS2B2_03260 [Ktedonobacteraceae bacterium]